jgi:hypothetical protein
LRPLRPLREARAFAVSFRLSLNSYSLLAFRCVPLRALREASLT